MSRQDLLKINYCAASKEDKSFDNKNSYINESKIFIVPIVNNKRRDSTWNPFFLI
jgi:hypothetical protein